MARNRLLTVLPRSVVLEPQAASRKTVSMPSDAPQNRGQGLATTREIADHLRRSGKMSEALGLYQHLLQKSGPDAAVLDGYIRCAEFLNHDPEEGLLRVLRARPAAKEVRDWLIQTAWRGGNHQMVRDLVASAPDQPETSWLATAAASAMNMADDAEARRLYGLIREREPQNAAAVAGLARLKARKRDYSGVLETLEDNTIAPGAANLNEVALKMAAYRRLGRPGRAAEAASGGLSDLLASDNLHDTARLLDRLSFPAAAGVIRERIRGLEGDESRPARRRLAGHLAADGRISESVREYKRLGGRNWKSRVNPAHLQLFEVATRAFGSNSPDPEFVMLEQSLYRLPDDALTELLRHAAAIRTTGEDPRRVLLVTGTLGAGGAERQVALTAMGLAEQGAAPGWPQLATLQSLDIPGSAHLLPEIANAGIAHHDLGMEANSHARLPLRLAYCDDLVSLLPAGFRQQVIALCHLIVRLRPGVVHGWQDVTGAAAALAGLLCGVERIVIGTRSIAPDRKEGRNRSWLRDLMRGLMKLERVRLVNNSRSGAADYCRWLDLPPGRIACIPNGFSLPDGSRKETRADTATFTVGGVMRLTEEKRPDLWLDTVIGLIEQGRDVRGLLVGDGPLMAELAARIADRDLDNRIELAGRRGDMATQYARMDVLMLTSRTEGLPNVLVEAQAYGLPVVSTDAGGASETFVDGQTGLLSRSATVEGLARQLGMLLDDPEKRLAMGRAGADHVRSEFGMDRMLDRTAAVYGWPVEVS